MRKLIAIAQKFWRELVIVLGVYLLVSGVFDFNVSVGCGTGRINRYGITERGCEGTVAYGYTDEGTRQIALGSSLIAIGILANMRKRS